MARRRPRNLGEEALVGQEEKCEVRERGKLRKEGISVREDV